MPSQSPARPCVVLFDIDGTILHSAGASRRAIERAFAAVTGRSDGLEGWSFGGMTDPGIVRRGLERQGDVSDDGAVSALLARYYPLLEQTLREEPRVRVHAGILDAMAACEARDALAMGIGTGNTATGAAIKLRRVCLEARFGFGGYGSDSENRAELIAAGAARGAAQLGVALGDCRVVIVGDSVRDVTAAHANGAECVAVTTGASDEAALRAAGASAIFADLTVAGALDALLHGPAPTRPPAAAAA